MYKKIICFVLTTALIFVTFAGCASKQQIYEKTTVLADQYSINENNDVKTDVELPYTIKDKGITVLEIKHYSGKFIETGKDEESSTGIAVLVRNDSGKYADYIRITVNASNGSQAVFDAGYIGPGMSVWIQDENRNENASIILKNADVIVSYSKEAWDIKRLNILISYDENRPNNIIAENIGDIEMDNVQIFYRRIQDGILVGGIVYNTKLGDLKKGETLNILANHFDKYFTLCKVTTD
jgi:hypothetical protein